MNGPENNGSTYALHCYSLENTTDDEAQYTYSLTYYNYALNNCNQLNGQTFIYSSNTYEITNCEVGFNDISGSGEGYYYFKLIYALKQ